jgi:hypothetical protein
MLNVAHIHYELTDTNVEDMINVIRNGNHKYVNKVFYLTNEELINDISTIFPTSLIHFIGKIKNKYSQYVESFPSINDSMQKLSIEEISVFTSREMRSIKSNDVVYQKIDIDVVLVGKLNYKSSMSNIKKIVDCVRNNRIIGGNYVFDTVHLFYCGEKKDFLNKFLKIDTFIEIETIEKASKQMKMLTSIVDNTSMYNLIDRKKYYYTWFAYSKVLEKILKDEENSIKSDIPRLTLCIDLYDIDFNSKSIDLTSMFSSMIGALNNKIEHIYYLSDNIAFGTEKIMKYYMSLYNHYGSYIFKQSLRALSENDYYSKDEYFKLNEKLSLKSEIQLFEHLYHFGDMIISKIEKCPSDMCIEFKTKNIILVTYYGIYEQFIYVKNILEMLGYIVHDFPYMKYHNEPYGELAGDDSVVKIMEIMMNNIKPSHVLWWVLNIKTEKLEEIVKYNINVKHLYFNWDEPYNWIHVDGSHKAKYLNTAFITCEETTTRYINAGSLHSYCLYTGYSPNVHYPMWMGVNFFQYKYDISFICTNLYENVEIYPDQLVSRKQLVTEIYDNQDKYNYKFALFGSQSFSERFPKSYKGFVKYNDTNDVFNHSKINICTHVVGNKKGYLNERVFMIMATGGLLMIDPIPGIEHILINGHNCIYINQDRIVSQIDHILKNYSQYEKIKLNAYETAKKYTWDDWGMRMEEKLLHDYIIA